MIISSPAGSINIKAHEMNFTFHHATYLDKGLARTKSIIVNILMIVWDQRCTERFGAEHRHT